MKRLLPAPLEFLLTPAAAQGLRVHAATRPTQQQPPLPRLRELVSWPTCQPLVPKVPGHSRRHSLAASAVPRAHGRSWKKGRQRSQSVPVVLCWHRQTSWPVSLGPHSLACPLHLHLGKEHGGWGSGNRVGTGRGGVS